MRPPAEQLIRDYLNRLSVAARTRLQSDERRAFLARTRDFIETQSGVRDTADPAAVIRSTTCTGGNAGATGNCGTSSGGEGGATEAVGRKRLYSAMSDLPWLDRGV